MFRYGLLALVGWGSNDKLEMAENTIQHSLLVAPNLKSEEFQRTIRLLHKLSKPIYRSLDVPDQEYQDYFKARLKSSSEIIGRPTVDKASEFTQRTQDQFGYIGVLGLGQQLGNSELTARQQREVSELLFLSWGDYQIDNFDNVYIYQSIRNLKDPFQSMNCPRTKRPVLTLAYSPFVFERFILNYLSQREYLRLLDLPIEPFTVTKNGVWQAFCDAYHDLIFHMSDLFGSLDLLSSKVMSISDPSTWDSLIAELKARKGFNFSAFVHGVSAFAGVVLTIPFLGHVARILMLFIERLFGSLSNVSLAKEDFKELAFLYRLQRQLST